MKLNKKFIIVFLALFYFIVIQRIITLYLFPDVGVNTSISQLQQETLSYVMIIKIVLLLMALSAIPVFLVLKKNLGTEDLPAPKEMLIILILLISAIIPITALLNIFLTGDPLFSSILIIYGVIFTATTYIMEN
ncbi:MAG: hypothetical protein KO318_09340 [Methanobacterium sp.]|jgi:hypothetical protein|uniref:Uncharacterized protein n=1 Tax=Methanobacterium subterraneum TaxID=59277 RepID=A0A2H4VDT0_9EURY|nr:MULTISPECIES: hypothetical protein [Methanobacterium]MBW4257576.1 hypothetical protein [Methanobacterium sp. YSL]PKL71677.1 MAG: hypothetical protein CVV29_09380 [Methanobacteriales archaeon HGW-Methanobacteriales-2]AUB56246.1 hypothetical protein BK007_09630 [Methanobacterium subterraneum]AUB58885.1 hypothetical protein BK008_11560 [Methanobacterium sp. MZ-A1]AUB59886.1 hypothetical protein BK009_03865 [Methanobacterium subterraneum]